MRTRTGGFRVGRKTIKKRLRAKLKEIQGELRKRMHQKIGEVGAWLRQVLMGYYQFYAVPGNKRSLNCFRERLLRLWYTTLRRRSQKGRVTWERMYRLADRFFPRAPVLHPWPTERFYAKHPR